MMVAFAAVQIVSPPRYFLGEVLIGSKESSNLRDRIRKKRQSKKDGDIESSRFSHDPREISATDEDASKRAHHHTSESRRHWKEKEEEENKRNKM